ncbi:AzlD domain-containing protein [Ilumatobacter nonamiensis]|uniref:AzlD domain-containing protein n=1 Tax=Ilumatobacter nonamiensis TaxID=467093 RepID=UPI00034D2297|nr:AzlD domain-containing protein [Ilumatobacter nonamiensis]
MSTSAALAALFCGAIGTYFARSSLILLLAGRSLPASVERALQNVGPAVLAALTINLAVGSSGLGGVEFAEVAALVVAGGVAAWWKNLTWTFVAGMATLWICSAIT